ncbi:MAG TPA: hypothetical protein V6C84_00650 [Coleofasciculaceae cyanobacterium]|jgi:hypothetical protein
MIWRERLSNLPTTQVGNREAQEPVTTEIILEFMSEEVYPRLKAAQVSFVESGLESTISPELAEEILSDAPSVCLSIKKRMNGSECKYSLLFQRQIGFNIDVKLDGRGGHQVLGVFNLDREPASPTVFVESYLKDFSEQFI